MEKNTFDLEQEHLTSIYNKLLEMKKKLQQQISELDEKASEEKNDIRDNIRLDYADDETTMETLGEIEVWNRYIDTYNIESNSLGKRLRTVNKLLESPYFAKVTLQFDPSEDSESYYIGSAAISENGYDQLIIDWRSPIAEVYYNQENGMTHYTVDGRKIPVDLQLRRQFELSKEKLISYFDTQVAIEDPMLLMSLSQTHSDKMQAITATIQKEQNTIIRYPDVSVLLVNGIAGSGKTSVLLQRIAYLFYQKRQTLRPDQVCLMTLNPVFREYIDNVLPDLGETNPTTLTWQEFLAANKVPVKEGNCDYTEPGSLSIIRDMLPTLVPCEDDFLDICQKDRTIMKKGEVLNVIRKFSQFPMGVRLIQTALDELEQTAKNALHNMDDNDDDESEGVSKSEEAEENRINNDYGGALKCIRNCGFINITHIAQRILQREEITASEWLFTKLELTGECDRNMLYVMVDEVQDYTISQMMIFKKYFPRARFMLLGDEFQSIRQGTVSFNEIQDLFSEDNKEFVELPLMTSYRSSPEITDVFASILPEEKKMQVSSVQRPGEKIVTQTCDTAGEYAQNLRELIKESEKKSGLTAVICRNQENVEHITALLGNDAPMEIEGDAPLPKSGAILISLQMAKGLEFDQVILADADNSSYPDDELGRHCFYTAVSRATRHLSIIAQKSLTDLLK